MSRIGKKTITIPSGTSVNFDGAVLTVKGPLGELSRNFKPDIEIEVTDKEINMKPKKVNKFSRALWGTYSSHVTNMIEGVNKLFEKKLIIEGVGFRAELKGDKLVMNLGFSHQIGINIPNNIKVSVEKDTIIVSGSDKEEVGRFAADVRSFKKPEPYKGKGIRYQNEVIRRKQGKKSA